MWDVWEAGCTFFFPQSFIYAGKFNWVGCFSAPHIHTWKLPSLPLFATNKLHSWDLKSPSQWFWLNTAQLFSPLVFQEIHGSRIGDLPVPSWLPSGTGFLLEIFNDYMCRITKQPCLHFHWVKSRRVWVERWWYSRQVKYSWCIEHKVVFSKGYQIQGQILSQQTILYWKAAFQHTRSSTLPWQRLLQGSFHYFLAKDLGTDNKPGGRRNGSKTKNCEICLADFQVSDSSFYLNHALTLCLAACQRDCFNIPTLHSLWFSPSLLLDLLSAAHFHSLQHASHNKLYSISHSSLCLYTTCVFLPVLIYITIIVTTVYVAFPCM